MTTEVKVRKPRARKSASAGELMTTTIMFMSLSEKVELLKLIKDSIDKDGKHLSEQLALITNLK